jgi:hypothetical protein
MIGARVFQSMQKRSFSSNMFTNKNTIAATRQKFYSNPAVGKRNLFYIDITLVYIIFEIFYFYCCLFSFFYCVIVGSKRFDFSR